MTSHEKAAASRWITSMPASRVDDDRHAIGIAPAPAIRDPARRLAVETGG
jgi:hypothetical protein